VHSLPESAIINDLIQRYTLATVNSFVYAFNENLENILLPNNVIIMIRKHGEYQERLEEGHGDAQDQQRWPSQVGVPIQVELESNSDSRNSPH
jgi:hypothetical protein